MTQKHLFLYRTTTSKEAEQMTEESQAMPDALQFDAGIAEEPLVSARAGIFAYLNAVVKDCNLRLNVHSLMSR